MSTPPQEADTRTVDLSFEQRWILHHALVTRGDAYIDEDEPVPPWLCRLLDLLESNRETMTVWQGRTLISLLEDDRGNLPEPDRAVAADVVEALEASLQ